MAGLRVDELITKLEKGYQKTREFFEKLTPEQWQQRVYADPDWTAHNILAHFISAEQNLLELTQNVAGGGPGAPPGIDIDQFNAREQDRLRKISTRNLMAELAQSRQRTITWARTLKDEQLDNKGRHPALGEISVEAMLTAIYGHQILHMRDLLRKYKDAAKVSE